MGNIQILINHKYKCCLKENVEEVESEEENNNDRQIIKQLPAIEAEPSEDSPVGTASLKRDDSPAGSAFRRNDSFATTIPCKFYKN